MPATNPEDGQPTLLGFPIVFVDRRPKYDGLTMDDWERWKERHAIPDSDNPQPESSGPRLAD